MYFASDSFREKLFEKRQGQQNWKLGKNNLQIG
jgi:hypothetical protein